MRAPAEVGIMEAAASLLITQSTALVMLAQGSRTRNSQLASGLPCSFSI